jgi:hypothetical protein
MSRACNYDNNDERIGCDVCGKVVYESAALVTERDEVYVCSEDCREVADHDDCQFDPCPKCMERARDKYEAQREDAEIYAHNRRMGRE